MNQDSIINLIHIFLFFPLLAYVYYLGYKKTLSSTVCRILLIVAVIGITYHSFLIKQKLDSKQEYKIWVNLVHILAVFPLLFFIGYKCEDTKRPFLELLLLMSFGALGYHAFNFIRYYP